MNITTSKQIMKEDKGSIQVGEQREVILATQKVGKILYMLSHTVWVVYTEWLCQCKSLN